MAVMHSVVALAGWQPCLVDGCEGHQGRRYKATVKNEESVRWLPLPDQLWAALLVHQAAQVATPKPENYLDHDLIFCEDDGGPLHLDQVTETFHELVEAAGLPALSGPHALRHFATSMMLAQGAPAEEVSKITGNSVKMIGKVYGHIIEECARASVQRHADVILHGRPLPGFTTEEPGLAGVASLAAAAATRRGEPAGQSAST